MKYSDLIDKFSLNETRCFYGHIVAIKSSNLYIDGIDTGKDYNTIDEAIEYVKEFVSNLEMKKSITESYDPYKVAAIIKKYNPDLRVTNSLIENCIDQVVKKEFTVDPAVQELQKPIMNKNYYVLEDSTTVAIDSTTKDQLNILLKDQPDIVAYMKENVKNFLHVVNKIVKD